jgi:hypothetical protein
MHAVGHEGRYPSDGGELTCAKQDDSGANMEPSHDTVGLRQGAMYKAEDPQDGGVVVHKFEELAALGTLDFIP